MYETRQHKGTDSHVSHHSMGGLLQLMDNRGRNLNQLVMQMVQHVTASCSITTKETGEQKATCRSQSALEASRSSIIRDMNKTVMAGKNALYQCAEPKSLYSVLLHNELDANNLVRDELKSIQWSDIKYYDDEKPDELLGDATPCNTCNQWINPATLKPYDKAINRVELKYETDEQRVRGEQEKEAKREIIEEYRFKSNQNEVGNLRIRVREKVKELPIKVEGLRKTIKIVFTAETQDQWNHIKTEFPELKK